jgi:GDPmannose 4,6-dehydratase
MTDLYFLGISGQDGYYLSRFLLTRGYEVHGLLRPSSKARRFLTEFPIEHLKIHYGDILDLACLIQILQSTRIDEIYHLAAQSHVGISFDLPLLTNDINAMGTLRLLNAITILGLQNRIKFYNVRKPHSNCKFHC